MSNQLLSLFENTISSLKERQIALLISLCQIESGSEMVTGVNRVGRRIGQELGALGLAVDFHPNDRFGDHLVATTGVPGPQIILGGHLDTTYIDYSILPKTHIDSDFLIGPGTSDMRGGLIVFLTALECLKAVGLLEKMPITVIFNSDEERGAPTSRDLFLDHARNCKTALFSECAGADNQFVISRRAKLSYQLDVKGIGKHAGTSSADKVSALIGLSHAIIAIEQLNERFDGSAFNVGRAWGGIASNTVPDSAAALVDIRYLKADQEQPIRDAMEAACRKASASSQGAELTLTQTSYRPAWEKGPQNAGLSRLIQDVANDIGQNVRPESRGGTADSNWFGASGVACVDGLGPRGFDEHTPAERMHLPSLFERALLVSQLLVSLGDFRDSI